MDDRAGAPGRREEPDAGRPDEGRAQHELHDEAKNANPFALPGVNVHTKGGYQYPISQVTLVQYQNNVFQPIGKLINGRGA